MILQFLQKHLVLFGALVLVFLVGGAHLVVGSYTNPQLGCCSCLAAFIFHIPLNHYLLQLLKSWPKLFCRDKEQGRFIDFSLELH